MDLSEMYNNKMIIIGVAVVIIIVCVAIYFYFRKENRDSLEKMNTVSDIPKVKPKDKPKADRKDGLLSKSGNPTQGPGNRGMREKKITTTTLPKTSSTARPKPSVDTPVKPSAPVKPSGGGGNGKNNNNKPMNFRAAAEARSKSRKNNMNKGGMTKKSGYMYGGMAKKKAKK